MSSFQGGPFVDVLSNQGKNPLSKFKISNPRSIRRHFDKSVNTYVVSIEGSLQNRLSVPKDERREALGLIQQFLCIQLYASPGAPLYFELNTTDTKKTRRRLLISTAFRSVHRSPLHTQIPLLDIVRGKWINAIFDLKSLVDSSFDVGVHHSSLDSLSIGPQCKVRRIFTIRSCPPDPVNPPRIGGIRTEPLPRALQFPPSVGAVAQILDERLLMSPGSVTSSPEKQDSLSVDGVGIDGGKPSLSSTNPRYSGRMHVAFGTRVPVQAPKLESVDVEERLNAANRLGLPMNRDGGIMVNPDYERETAVVSAASARYNEVGTGPAIPNYDDEHTANRSPLVEEGEVVSNNQESDWVDRRVNHSSQVYSSGASSASDDDLNLTSESLEASVPPAAAYDSRQYCDLDDSEEEVEVLDAERGELDVAQGNAGFGVHQVDVSYSEEHDEVSSRNYYEDDADDSRSFSSPGGEDGHDSLGDSGDLLREFDDTKASLDINREKQILLKEENVFAEKERAEGWGHTYDMEGEETLIVEAAKASAANRSEDRVLNDVDDDEEPELQSVVHDSLDDVVETLNTSHIEGDISDDPDSDLEDENAEKETSHMENKLEGEETGVHLSSDSPLRGNKEEDDSAMLESQSGEEILEQKEEHVEEISDRSFGDTVQREEYTEVNKDETDKIDEKERFSERVVDDDVMADSLTNVEDTNIVKDEEQTTEGASADVSSNHDDVDDSMKEETNVSESNVVEDAIAADGYSGVDGEENTSESQPEPSLNVTTGKDDVLDKHESSVDDDAGDEGDASGNNVDEEMNNDTMEESVRENDSPAVEEIKLQQESGISSPNKSAEEGQHMVMDSSYGGDQDEDIVILSPSHVDEEESGERDDIQEARRLIASVVESSDSLLPDTVVEEDDVVVLDTEGKPEEGAEVVNREEEVELIFDEVLNCYYDPKSGKYYEVKDT